MRENNKFNLNHRTIFWRFTICLILFLGFRLQVCQAELKYQDVKGVHDLIKSEYKYLSPIYGFTLLGTKTIENMRFYGNFGKKNGAFDCLEKFPKISRLLSAKNDCPQDSTAELILRLFPSPNGVTFAANPIDSDPLSHLRPEIIGKILERTSLVQDSDLLDVEKTKQFAGELKEILSEGLNPVLHFEKIRSRLKKLQRDRVHATSEKQRIELEIVSLKEKLKKYHAHRTRKVGRGNEKDFEDIARTLLGALSESRGATHVYPRYFPEHLLLAYFWKKGSSKEDLLKLFTGMSKVLKDSSFFKDSEKRSRFFAQKYSGADYNLASVTGEPEVIAKGLLEKPEKLVFYTQQDKLEPNLLPPSFYFAQAMHSSSGDGPYSECGDTSLLSFLNSVFYNQKTKKIDDEYIKEIEKNIRVNHPGYTVYPNLIAFYQRHPDPNSFINQEIRDEWKKTLASGLSGELSQGLSKVSLCSIVSSVSGIDNMMEALDHLLFYWEQNLDLKKSSGASPQGSPKASPMTRSLDRFKKLNVLCKTLSREGFELSWVIKETDSKKTNPLKINEMKYSDLEFRVNGKPSFIWQFKEGHFSIQEIPASKKNWKDQVAEDLAREISQSGRRSSSVLLHWFVNEKNWDNLLEHLPNNGPLDQEQARAVQMNLIYSLPLSSNDGKLTAFQKILQYRMETLYPLAKRLQSELPVKDRDVQKRISSVLADYDYPWGEPSQTVTGASYQRVLGRPDLVGLGKSWQNLKDSEKLIWGDTAKLEDGTDHKMDQLAAEAYCRPLGARLPTKEEFERLAKDLGNSPSHYYQPTFLPNLYNRWFWSSTIVPDLSQYASTFHGSTGIVTTDNRSSPNGSVRCVSQ